MMRNKIEEQRLALKKIIENSGAQNLILEIKNNFPILNDLYAKHGISALGRQIQELRYQQCKTDSQEKKELLARDLLFKVVELRNRKKEIKNELTHYGTALKFECQKLIHLLDLEKIKPHYQLLINALEEVAKTDPCSFYQGQDGMDAASIIELEPFFHKMLILTLFSSASLMHAYGGYFAKLKF